MSVMWFVELSLPSAYRGLTYVATFLSSYSANLRMSGCSKDLR